MVDNYNGRFYEDILLYYDGEPLMKKIRGLVPYDIIDVKGVVNILQAEKNIQCPYCGYINTIHGKQTTFVYPIFLSKIQSMSGPVNDGTMIRTTSATGCRTVHGSFQPGAPDRYSQERAGI